MSQVKMKYPIAVGYELNQDSIETFKNAVVELFSRKTNSGKTLHDSYPHFNLDHFKFENKILSGVFYGHSTSMSDDDCLKSSFQLKEWYEKHITDDSIFIDSFYIHYSKKKNGDLNPLLIIAACHNISGHRFYSFLSNMSEGYATTMHKRNIRNGNYGHPIQFNPSIKISAKPYLYEK